VAYADFVTALMALFIVLWMMNTIEKVKLAVRNTVVVSVNGRGPADRSARNRARHVFVSGDPTPTNAGVRLLKIHAATADPHAEQPGDGRAHRRASLTQEHSRQRLWQLGPGWRPRE
jgi:flagellar motor protein MotB